MTSAADVAVKESGDIIQSAANGKVFDLDGSYTRFGKHAAWLIQESTHANMYYSGIHLASESKLTSNQTDQWLMQADEPPMILVPWKGCTCCDNIILHSINKNKESNDLLVIFGVLAQAKCQKIHLRGCIPNFTEDSGRTSRLLSISVAPLSKCKTSFHQVEKWTTPLTRPPGTNATTIVKGPFDD